jgi:hypothetical protein
MLLDPLTDTIPLTNGEQARFRELESVVERTLDGFLECGRALIEIRNKRLFRQEFATFEDYCVKRWGFSGSRGHKISCQS